MRIKFAIDVEISPRAKRIILWALPVAILVAGGVAYASLPHAFGSGEVLTSANLNADLNDLDTRLGSVESVRAVTAITTWDGTHDWQIVRETPNDSITASGGAASTPCTLTFTPAFSAAPVCLGSLQDDKVNWTVTASSITAVGTNGCVSPSTWSFTCIGPR